MTYEVDLVFDNDGEPTFFVSEDGKLKWPYDKALVYDWKDVRGEKEGFRMLSKKGEVIELFDGSDTIIMVLAADAIKVRAKKR